MELFVTNKNLSDVWYAKAMEIYKKQYAPEEPGEYINDLYKSVARGFGAVQNFVKEQGHFKVNLKDDIVRRNVKAVLNINNECDPIVFKAFSQIDSEWTVY